MIWAKLVFGGFGRRGLEAVVALAVLAVAAAIVAGAMMVIEGAKGAMARAEREDRPDIIQVKSRFNRAVFETPRSGNLPTDAASTRYCSRSASPRCKRQSWGSQSGSRQ